MAFAGVFWPQTLAATEPAGTLRPGTAVLGTAVPGDCTLLRAAAEAAAAVQDWAHLEKTATAAGQEPACTPADREQIHHRLAALGAMLAAKGLAAGDPLARWRGVLERSAAAAPHWQMESWLADLARDQGRFTAAAWHYFRALDILNGPLSPEASVSAALPDEETLARLLRRAEQTRLLADEAVPLAPVPVLHRRDASPHVSSSPATSSPPVPASPRQRVILPIEFQFNTVTFTAKGAAAAANLLAFLQEQGSPAITVVGHTDDQGNPGHNLELSLRRAHAVRTYLLDHGYRGTVKAEGRGSREPLSLDDAGSLTTAQRRQLQRRVEILR